MSVTIKDVDNNVFRNFKAEAIRHGLKLGEPASEAFRLWIIFKKFSKVRDKDRMLNAARDMDELKKKSLKGWSVWRRFGSGESAGDGLVLRPIQTTHKPLY